MTTPERLASKLRAYGRTPLTQGDVDRLCSSPDGLTAGEMALLVALAQAQEDARAAIGLALDVEGYPFGGNHDKNDKWQRRLDALAGKYYP